MNKETLKTLHDALNALGNSRDFIYFSNAKKIPWNEDKQLLENTKIILRLQKLIKDIEDIKDQEEKPFKPWIGLTGDEIDQIYFATDDEGEAIELTEAKLKEKNT